MKRFSLVLIFALFLLTPLLFVEIDSRLHPKKIRIATGTKEGAYYLYAQKYAAELKKFGVAVEIVTTQGSADAALKVANKKVDFAFVQEGIKLDKDLYALCSVTYEPVWIFHSKDKEITSLDALVGGRIGVGERGSGIYPVATAILALHGVDANNTKLLFQKSYQSFLDLKKGDITALFYVASEDSKLVYKLLENPNFSLLSFPNASSYVQYFRKKGQRFFQVTLLEGGFDFQKRIPSEKKILLATTTLLITQNSDDSMVRLLLKVAQMVHSGGGIFHKDKSFPRSVSLQGHLHPEAKRFFEEEESIYEKSFDFWRAQSLEKLDHFVFLVLLPLITLFAFWVEVIMPSLHWYSRRKVIKWYDKINQIDTGIDRLSLEEALARKEELEKILDLVREQEDIPATHMEEFYTLQNQIANILADLQKRIDIHKRYLKQT